VRRRIVGLGDLEVIDVNVDRMFVVIRVGEGPFLNRTKPGLDQRYIWKCVVVERVDKGLRIRLTRVLVQKSAGDQDPSPDVGSEVRKVLE
jgi:hypothetical protein